MNDPSSNARAQPLESREARVSARETSVSEREQRLAQRELQSTDPERERLLVQIREANEHLILETLRANEQAAHANATRDAFLASEQQFLILANTLPMLAWYAGPSGDVLWCNQRWYEYAGSPSLQPHGGDWEYGGDWESALDPDDRARVVGKWREALRSSTPWEDQFLLRRHDGQYRWFLARALPLRDAEGRITRWLCTNTDIDDQKHAEALANSGSRAKDEFLALLGHELRNPLAPIRIALELMQARSPDFAARERAIILRQVDHLVRLVDDLLDISRITQGKVELRRQRVEISSVVARALEMSSGPLEQKSHTVTNRVAEAGLAVDADPDRLAQVIANLLTNAAKYTDAGGSIEIEAHCSGSNIVLQVRDDGIGVSHEMLSHVFEMFVQERQALDRPQGGLGLGLAISKNLVEMHGGSIRARSEGIGRGSTFEIELPASGGAEAVAADHGYATTPARPVAGESGVRRVLLVDDNDDAAELTAQALSALGHDVRVAHDGPSALAIARGFVPEVALLDIGLPGMDGYELAARMRELGLPERTHFIALTGYGEAAARERSRGAGFDVHLVKPVRVAELEEAIVRVTAGAVRPAQSPS